MNSLLHLLPDNLVLIIRHIIGTFKMPISQESCHFVLIQRGLADVVAVILVIDIIPTGFTACMSSLFLHGIFPLPVVTPVNACCRQQMPNIQHTKTPSASSDAKGDINRGTTFFQLQAPSQHSILQSSYVR